MLSKTSNPLHSKQPEVAVVYTHFPHYRESVFCKLKNSSSYDFQFFYDFQGVDNTIKMQTNMQAMLISKYIDLDH